jgi:hypothetical protein
VYGLWAVVRNQLATDDSFAFAKAVGGIKDRIASLPEAGGEAGGAEDAALRRLGLAPAAAEAPSGEAPQQAQQAQSRRGEQGAGPAAAAAPPPGEAAPAAWGPEEALAGRRAALLDCILAGKEAYSHPWAQTSVDLLVSHARAHAHRFAPCQRPALAAMAGFVAARRAARKLGPSAAEAARDATSFERARQEWGKATLSARGKVGAGGDNKTAQWLG